MRRAKKQTKAQMNIFTLIRNDGYWELSFNALSFKDALSKSQSWCLHHGHSFNADYTLELADKVENTESGNNIMKRFK